MSNESVTEYLYIFQHQDVNCDLLNEIQNDWMDDVLLTHAASLKNVSHFVNKIILFFKLKILIFDFHTRIHNTDLSSIFPSIFMLALLMSEFSALRAGLKVFADTGVRSFSPRVAVLTLNMLSVVPRKGTRLWRLKIYFTVLCPLIKVLIQVIKCGFF